MPKQLLTSLNSFYYLFEEIQLSKNTTRKTKLINELYSFFTDPKTNIPIELADSFYLKFQSFIKMKKHKLEIDKNTRFSQEYLNIFISPNQRQQDFLFGQENEKYKQSITATMTLLERLDINPVNPENKMFASHLYDYISLLNDNDNSIN